MTFSQAPVTCSGRVALITGITGKDDSYLGEMLLERRTLLLGFDNFNPYYEPSLKRACLQQLEATAALTGTVFELIETDLEDRAVVEAAFAEYKPSKVVNLGA